MQLRPYQQDIIQRARSEMQRVRRVLIQAPTGAGKTALTVHMMAVAAERGMRSFFCVHQNELLMQTSRALWKQKLEHGIIAAGRGRSPTAAQVASIMTLARRLDQYDAPSLIIIDEAHRAAAASYRTVLDAYPDAYVIGLTATPARTDGQGLGDMFDVIVEGPTIAQLIDAGYLCDYEILAPPQVADVSAVHTVGGDYNKGELESAVDRPSITGDAVSHYRKYATGKRCVVMCVTINHARHVREQYSASGVPAETIHGGMTDNEREAVLQRFADGQTLVITNVQLLIEGVDIPAIEVVQWLRPTTSLIVWMQGNGRGLRPAPGKEQLLILDHVGNCQRHGLPDDERTWSLESKKRKSRGKPEEDDVKIQQCKMCWHVFRPGPDACPKCGAPVVQIKREIEVVDGELTKIEAANVRKQERREQGSARSLAELIQLGVRRGLKRPDGWAANIYASREGRRPNAADFAKARAALVAIKSGGDHGQAF